MTIVHVPSAVLAPGALSRNGGITATDRRTGAARSLQKMHSRQGSLVEMSDLLSGQVDGISLQRGLVCTAQDKQLIVKLKAAAESGSSAMWDSVSNTLRTHFFNLTVAFLMPFYDFWGTPCPWISNHEVRMRAVLPEHLRFELLLESFDPARLVYC
jgi:hypothetical protein